MKKALWGVIIIILLYGIYLTSIRVYINFRYPKSAEQIACENKENHYWKQIRSGVALIGVCSKTYQDGGKICRSSKECEGRCIVNPLLCLEKKCTEGTCETEDSGGGRCGIATIENQTIGPCNY